LLGVVSILITMIRSCGWLLTLSDYVKDSVCEIWRGFEKVQRMETQRKEK
jgi:hypothetical protein